MTGPGSIEINPSRRIIKLEDVVCGSIITGTDKIRSGFGNGDCIYLDFKNSVFAIADGTERYPWASRDLLVRLGEDLEVKGVPDSADGWLELVNGVYSEQRYHFKTTFSCMSIKEVDDGIVLFISHGGDSVVTILDSINGSINYQTKPDMKFAGRSKQIDDVSEHHLIDKQLRVLIATDGFNDLLKYCVDNKLFKSIPAVFSTFPVHMISEQIHSVLDGNEGMFEYDDIGFMIIDPFQMKRVEGIQVLIGGTRSHEEMKFLKEKTLGMEDKWLADIECEKGLSLMEVAGIMLKS